jgi:hypothetical protein
MSEAPAPILELARVRKEFALQGSLAARMLGLAPL